MTGEKGLSRSLTYQANNYLESSGINSDAPVIVDGVGVDFPYSEIEFVDYNTPIPEGVWESYQTLKTLFTPENMSPQWKSLIKEVNKERKTNGCKSPVDLIYGLYFLTEESSLAQEIGLPRFERLSNGGINFQDGAMITKSIDTVLADPELRKEYKHLLIYQLPDESNIPLEKDNVRKVLEKTGIKGGILLDLGCGIGRDTEEWSEKLGLFTVGLERQYHRQWYDPYWKEGRKQHSNLNFIIGDFNQSVPVKDECVDAVVFQHVAQHVTQDSLEKGLQEGLRVLKMGGWLFVGPQHTKDYSDWRYFKKEATENGEVFHFKEYRYYDLVPEDKPKRWRRKKIPKKQ